MPTASSKRCRSRTSGSPRPSSPTFPAPGAKQRGQARAESITDLAFADGRVFVAGLSNEEFSSRLIAIPFPFSSEGFDGAAIEIYHGAHGRFETKSPIRTFVTYRIKNEPYMLAAYTCTPLVKLPVADLKAGAHVKGTTIAELGNRNRPLDMIVYQKDGKDYLLMTNSSRGVMKIPTEGAGSAESITEPVRGGGTKGLGYDTIASLKGVVQMDQLDNRHAVILVDKERDDRPRDDRTAVIGRLPILRPWLFHSWGDSPRSRGAPRRHGPPSPPAADRRRGGTRLA